ncbi:MAG: tetratricopeptide repeat protein, partial [Pyrinomonadaceae bacterium]
MQARFARRPVSLAAAALLLACAVGRTSITRAGSTNAPDAAQAQAALSSGKALLRRNRAGEAMPQLEQALALFTQAGDRDGAAAARDQIGDIYQRYGQYQTALDSYQTAFDTFCGEHEQANANLMLIKIGETHYLAGDPEAARASFARMNQCGANNNGVAADGNNDRKRGGALFLPASAAISLASCPALSSHNPNDQQQNEQTLGHGPTNSRAPSVRMDLRVVDQDGNPINGVHAKLESERGDNGLKCDCEHFTQGDGSILMDPIHFTHTLKLTLEAKGFEPLQLNVNPPDLNQPYRVALQAKGAGAGALSPGHVASAARAGACFDLFRFFFAYAVGELGTARSDYDANNLAGARTHYQNVLAVSDENAPTGGLDAARLFRTVARTSLADIALREGRFADAARLYTQAISGAQKDNRLELAWAAQRGLGKALWEQAAHETDASVAARERNDALNAFRAALSTVETLFAGSLRADEARTNFLASTRDLFDDATSAFAESSFAAQQSTPVAYKMAHAQSSSSGEDNSGTDTRPLSGRALAYAAEAFRTTEQGRARALLDLIGESRAQITEGVPADLLARRADNLARQQEIADLLRGVRAPAAATPQDTVAKLEAELGRLSVDYNSIENQIRVASPRYSALVKTQPLSLAEVQQQVLDPQTALLEYSLGRDRSYLFAVTQTGLALYR